MPQSIVQPLRRWDPERIGPYALVGRLGAGAMGQVFLARSAAGRLVAVKTIRVELAEEAGFRARFAREVAAASRVSGVFTAAVIEADPDADLPWVATAYVPAPSLSTLVQKAGPLPVPAVRWLAAGCAEALASIHGAGLLHRDVKPSNVLVAPEGPRVIDFGVARAAERVRLTSTRGAAGTPSYMAPEQARDSTQASPASDVFSLGATLVYAATGHPPYRGETVMDVLVRLATEPPDLDGLPDELSALVTACLERVPRDRPSDTAILSGLGSFTLPAGAGSVYLPDSAMSVIADYTLVAESQHDPRLTAVLAAGGATPGGSDPGDWASDGSTARGNATDGSGAPASPDVTNGSQTPLPGFESPTALPAQPPPGFRAGQGTEAGEAPRNGQGLPGGRARSGHPAPPAMPGVPNEQEATGDPESHPVRLTKRTLSPLWTRVLIAVLLVAAGTAVGMAVRAADPSPSAGNNVTADSHATFGPLAPPPPSCTARAPGTTPELCLSQPSGDGDTVFVVHGAGFQPFAPVTVKLSGVDVSPVRLVTDLQGTFNYAIDQGHVFFPGPIPVGTYQVVATEPGGGSAEATFRVDPGALGGPPPGGPPPSGSSLGGSSLGGPSPGGSSPGSPSPGGSSPGSPSPGGSSPGSPSPGSSSPGSPSPGSSSPGGPPSVPPSPTHPAHGKP